MSSFRSERDKQFREDKHNWGEFRNEPKFGCERGIRQCDEELLSSLRKSFDESLKARSGSSMFEDMM